MQKNYPISFYDGSIVNVKKKIVIFDGFSARYIVILITAQESLFCNQ